MSHARPLGRRSAKWRSVLSFRSIAEDTPAREVRSTDDPRIPAKWHRCRPTCPAYACRHRRRMYERASSRRRYARAHHQLAPKVTRCEYRGIPSRMSGGIGASRSAALIRRIDVHRAVASSVLLLSGGMVDREERARERARGATSADIRMPKMFERLRRRRRLCSNARPPLVSWTRGLMGPRRGTDLFDSKLTGTAER